MNAHVKSIISTIAFYDAVGKAPLTKVELYKYLIYQDEASPISFGDFIELLDREWETLKPAISHCRGFYYLLANKNGYARRIETGKTAIQKWLIACRVIRLISFLPYVRMVAITGSVALHTTHQGSDIDVLIVAKRGHIWTTRLLVSLLTHVLGKRRHGTRIKDRICLNHYISDKETVLRPDNIFSRHICSTCVPVWRQKSYIPPFLQRVAAHYYTVGDKLGPLYSVRNFFEWVLTKTVAYALERTLENFQIRKMKGRQFIADSGALVFHHPRPANQEAMVLYEQYVKELGLSP
jgi:hypothetical protein